MTTVSEAAERSRARAEVERWNAEHPVGSVVVVRRDDGQCLTTRTRSAAEVTSSGHAVIFVERITGYYLLRRVCPVNVELVLLYASVALP